MNPQMQSEVRLIELRNAQSTVEFCNIAAACETAMFGEWKSDWFAARYEAQKVYEAALAKCTAIPTPYSAPTRPAHIP